MNKETLEEVAENTFGLVDPIFGKSPYRRGYESGLIKGAKWQQERMYSEEDILKAYYVGCKDAVNSVTNQLDFITAESYLQSLQSNNQNK